MFTQCQTFRKNQESLLFNMKNQESDETASGNFLFLSFIMLLSAFLIFGCGMYEVELMNWYHWQQKKDLSRALRTEVIPM